jgi:predicted phosphodiesterase
MDSLSSPDTVLAMDGPVLVFGGCYSNLEATVALRREAARLGIAAGNIVCTGDVVAYCADPVATVAAVRDWGVHVIMGNCEESLGWGKQDCGCGFEEGTACERLSVDWYAFANRELGAEDRGWMRSLPRRLDVTIAGRRLAVVHGSVDSINGFVFASTPWADKGRQIAQSGCHGVVGGHCGIPFSHAVDDMLWHNSGALGMPANDGTPRVWYSLFVPNGRDVEVRSMSLQYDAGTAVRKMRQRGLPLGYAEALETGLWPSCDVLPAAELTQRGDPITADSLFWSSRAP